MINKLKTKDFDYTGSNFTEKEIVENGHVQLSGKELLSKMSNMTIFGDYPFGYRFVVDIFDNGSAEGINNVGSHNFGKWIIDFEANTLKLEWENSWIDTITRAYYVHGNIEFYDVDTGKWRTTFKIFQNL